MINRYKVNSIIPEDNVLLTKPKYATSSLCSRIYKDCKSGILQSETITYSNNERLDKLSQRYYGNGLDWWIIAAASGLGWWLQINEGTQITIPTDINQIRSLYNL